MPPENPADPSSPLWTLRPMEAGDESFVIFTFLKSYGSSPEGYAMGVGRDREAEKRFWLGGESLIKSIIDNAQVTIAEAVDPDTGSRVIVGYVIHEDLAVVHWVLARRRFQQMGVAKSLMAPFMEVAPRQVLYTFRSGVRGLKIPSHFKYDAFRGGIYRGK